MEGDDKRRRAIQVGRYVQVVLAEGVPVHEREILAR